VNTSNNYNVSAHLGRLPDRRLNDRNITGLEDRTVFFQERKVVELKAITRVNNRHGTAAARTERRAMINVISMRIGSLLRQFDVMSRMFLRHIRTGEYAEHQYVN
jgi:hypothetical protein